MNDALISSRQASPDKTMRIRWAVVVVFMDRIASRHASPYATHPRLNSSGNENEESDVSTRNSQRNVGEKYGTADAHVANGVSATIDRRGCDASRDQIHYHDAERDDRGGNTDARARSVRESSHHH